MSSTTPTAVGILTSGGDAQGMNAALRAAARAVLSRGAHAYAIHDGYHGMVAGGNAIRRLNWNDLGGIMHRGGTVIGTARSLEFRTREGRLRAARNLLERAINRLVVIGGDGSLTGADTFRREWPDLLAELVATGAVAAELAAHHPAIGIVGLVGSIDNDFVGTDMTIGADTALQRITEAIDALASTAASHQRTFVVEVMGRRCGYLALMSAIAGTADYVFIPESPPPEGWQQQMCDMLRIGREAGRRDSIVIVAEGARDRAGNPISVDDVRRVLEDELHEDVRVTILGHVQRGGAPSAFDRWMSTLVGYTAAIELLDSPPTAEPQLIGMRYNRITRAPLMQCVEQTHAVADVIAAKDYEQAMLLRGGSFREAFQTFQTLTQALPSIAAGQRHGRIAVLHAGGLAAGMNTAVRAAVRLGLDRGHEMLVVQNGFDGLLQGDVQPFEWDDVSGWGTTAGANLGTSRRVPAGAEIEAVARTIAEHRIEALLVIGGWAGYSAAHALLASRDEHPALRIPIICLPASINNDLPGSEISIGADTALNSIVGAVDKIKQSAVAVRRCFVVEVMGRYCGYLALMSGLATGAERVYLHEEGVTLAALQDDIRAMIHGFEQGKRLSLLIRNENANQLYTTAFMVALFEEEGGGRFDVRQSILGHIQQGGEPSPFDRIQATRLASRCIAFLSEALAQKSDDAAFIGFRGGRVAINPLDQLTSLSDARYRRPQEQWWMELRPIADALSGNAELLRQRKE
jgi:6-phosphofructokinase 1